MTKTIKQIAESKIRYFIFNEVGDREFITAVKIAGSDFYEVSVQRAGGFNPVIFKESGDLKVSKLCQ